MQRAKLSGSGGQSFPAAAAGAGSPAGAACGSASPGRGSPPGCTLEASGQATAGTITHLQSQMGNKEGCYAVRPEVLGEWPACKVSCAGGPDVRACASEAVDCSSPVSSWHGVLASKVALGSSWQLKEVLQKAAPSPRGCDRLL